MVIYEVRLSIPKKLAGKLAKWLPEHVKRVMLSPGFRGARVYRSEPSVEDEERLHWAVQYEVESRQALESYMSERAPALRAEAQNEFGEELHVSRQIFDSVETYRDESEDQEKFD